MLDGFVVPHAHFRVFHGNAAAESTGKTSNDQVALLFSARGAETVPTDLHLREFAQLEAQVKAIQQQQQQHGPTAHPSSRLVNIAQAGVLAECFSFYSRLMTPESFTWPDFLTTVFVKLTEHFIASENDLVRKTILDVLRCSGAHVSRVVDSTKILTLVKGLLNQSGDAGGKSSKVWAMQLVAAMPTLMKDDTVVHSSILQSLKAVDMPEKSAACEATRSILPHSRTLREAFISIVLKATSPELATLLPLAIAGNDPSLAQQAWNYCASLFHVQVSDNDALLCLRAATEVASLFPQDLLAQHLNLVRYVVLNDPRASVVSAVWSMAAVSGDGANTASTHLAIYDMIQTQLLSEGPSGANAGALLALSLVHPNETGVPSELVAAARKFASKTPATRSTYVKLLARCIKSDITKSSTQTSARPSRDSQDVAHLDELFQQLAPLHFERRRNVWLLAVKTLESLAIEYPNRVGERLGHCYAQLLRLARSRQSQEMEEALWIALSHVSHHCLAVVVGVIDLMNSVPSLSSSKVKQAIAVCMIRANGGMEVEGSKWESQCGRLVDTSPEERFTVARVAMIHGAAQFAARLLEPIVDEVEDECFGSWFRALLSISQAEEIVKSEQAISMEAQRQLLSGKAFLDAVEATGRGFEFQARFISARLKWMDLMLRAQQYAGEIAHSQRCGGIRERQLSEAFQANASEFMSLRASMLCAPPADRDALVFHAHQSVLLASTVMSLLVQKEDKPEVVAELTPSTTAFVPSFRRLASLKSESGDKVRKLQTLHGNRRPLVGATIFAQLLRAVCSLPFLIPHQFFRSVARPYLGMCCNLQLLTPAEATSYSSKPRSRSQLGVALGADFTSTLHGSIAVPRASELGETAKALKITITLVFEKADTSAVDGSSQVVDEVTIPFANRGQHTSLVSNGLLYLPVEAPIVVPAELLKAKGTYTVQATAELEDTNSETWTLAATGGRRSIIVY